jgi:fumarylpyruvate hydrolase
MSEIGRRHLLRSSALLGAGIAAVGNVPAAAASPAALFEVAERSFIPIVGSDQVFPVRRIYCVGRNYAAHSREMGSDPTREPPFFFQKPNDAIQNIKPGQIADHPYPPVTKNYHYELELVVALSKGGRNIQAATALDCVFGYAVGLDMTRRDLQQMMGNEKKPWEIGKAFDHSAPIGPLHPASSVGHLKDGLIRLTVNGVEKQKADLSQMIWNVAEQIANLSQYYELFPGDIIYSGTPENVGPVVPGDLMVGHIDRIGEIQVKVV